MRYLRRALEEPLPGGERGELLLELGGAEASLRAPMVVAHLREALSLLRVPERRAEASLALGHALYWAGDEEQGVSRRGRSSARRWQASRRLLRPRGDWPASCYRAGPGRGSTAVVADLPARSARRTP